MSTSWRKDRDPNDRYAKISRRLYADKKFRALSRPAPNAQSLFFYLLSGPEGTSVPGLIGVGEAALAEALEWPLASLRRCFTEIEQASMVKADWKARVVWVRNALRHNPPSNASVIKGWKPHLALVPECALKDEALAAMGAWLADFAEWAPPAFRIACGHRDRHHVPHHDGHGVPDGERDGHRHQKQDQKQKQDQDQKQTQKKGMVSEEPETKVRLMRAFARRFETETRSMFQEGAKCDWDVMARWFEKTSVMREVTADALIAVVLENWFTDPWVIAQKFPVGAFAKSYPNFLDRKDPQRSGKTRPPTTSTTYVEKLGEFGEVPDA
jgi:hypothetical protein